jgi:hypothetical protein
LEFHPTTNGLHIVDLKQIPEAAYLLVNDIDIDDNISRADSSPDHQVHVNTLRQNFEGYTKKQVQQAERACCLMGMVAHPSKRNFQQAMVHLNMLKDCPVTNDSICNAHNIYGLDLASIRGKTVEWKPERMVMDYVKIPKKFLSIHGRITLVADIMFVNSIPFLVLVSCSIYLITIEHAPPPQTASSLGALLLQIVCVCTWTGFTVSTILMDSKFEKVSCHVPGININTTVAAEHVREIEQKIRVVKDCTWHYLYPTLQHTSLANGRPPSSFLSSCG